MSNNNSDFTPNYGDSKFEKKKHFGFDKDTNSITFRILPQPKGVKFGTPAYNERKFDATWHRYINSVFGFKNMEGKLRVFESPLVKNNKTKMIDVPCAATELINSLKGKLEEAKAVNGDAAVISRLNQLVGMNGTYSINANQHMNVVLLDGSIGELRLRHKAFLVLKAEIDKLRNEGVDPVSLDNGRFFTVSRSVNGRDTVFSASVYKEKIHVDGIGEVEKPFAHSVNDDIRTRLETEGFDLNTIFLRLTSDEVAQIVKEADLSSGKSPACDRFFDLRWKAERDAKKGNAPTATATATQATPPATPAQTAAPAQAQGSQEPGGPASQATTASSTATTVAPTQVKAQGSQEAPLVISELSDADFWKSVNIQI